MKIPQKVARFLKVTIKISQSDPKVTNNENKITKIDNYLLQIVPSTKVTNCEKHETCYYLNSETKKDRMKTTKNGRKVTKFKITPAEVKITNNEEKITKLGKY